MVVGYLAAGLTKSEKMDPPLPTTAGAGSTTCGDDGGGEDGFPITNVGNDGGGGMVDCSSGLPIK